MVGHAVNPSTLEPEADGSLGVRNQPGLQRVLDQSGLHSETLSLKQNKTKTKVCI